MATKPKSKLAYLSYDQIQPRIETGELDQYDLVYEKNQKILYMIDKDKNVVPISSRLVSYQSEEEAIVDLNNRTDTYPGQIINVLVDGKYEPFTVNYNNLTESYIITPINSFIASYNDLQDIPIINMVGDTEIDISLLSDGYYRIIGNYILSANDPTHRMTTKYILFAVEHVIEEGNEVVYISEITGKRVKRYIVDSTTIIEDVYVLASELEQTIIDTLDENVDKNISRYIDDNHASSTDISDLFS